MKVKEKVALMLKGVSTETIKELEEQEAKEIELELQESDEDEKGASGNSEEGQKAEPDEKDLLISQLNEKIAGLEKTISEKNASSKTVKQKPEKQYDAVDVFKELFNPDQEKEK